MRSAPNCHRHVRLGPPGLLKTVPPCGFDCGCWRNRADCAVSLAFLRVLVSACRRTKRLAIFTVRDAVQSWLDDQVEHNRHGSFGAETRARCEKTLLPFMGSLRIEQVTAGTLFNYRAHVSGLKGRRGPLFSPRTVRMYLGDLRGVIKHALTLGVLDRSPVPLRGWLPKKEDEAPDVLTRDEQAALNALPGDHGRVVRLLLGTGIRWGEAVRAQVQDIQAGKLVIRKSK